MFLIMEPIGAPADPEMFNRHREYAERVARRGKLVDGAALSDASIATTLKFTGDEILIIDGPHAETKEHLGGYYLVECVDLDEAMDLARHVPVMTGGSLEIRPLVE
jgi:hypothetical protein